MPAGAVIHVATGVLMQRRDCTPAEARTLLLETALRKQLMVSEMAELIIADRDLR